MSDNEDVQSLDGEFNAVIINPEASKIELMDMISQRLSHLEAMTLLTWGPAGDGFRQVSDEAQSTYMWMIDRSLRETHNLVNALWDQHICKK